MKVMPNTIFTSLGIIIGLSCLIGYGCSQENHHDTHENHSHGNTSDTSAFKIPEGKVFFQSPLDGATVKSPMTIQFGVEKVGIKPISEGIVHGTGHHHLLVNEGPIEAGVIIPSNDTHIHFGKGQIETTLELNPGTYTLTMQLADGIHRSYGKELADSIEITVIE